MSDVIQTIIRQVEAQGVNLRGMTFVTDDDGLTVRFAKRGQSIVVTYVPGLDLYTVRVFRYDPKTIVVREDRTVEGVYADSLPMFFSRRAA
jgi:hypothetical protein